MTYNQLTINERACIYQLKKINMSIRDNCESFRQKCIHNIKGIDLYKTNNTELKEKLELLDNIPRRCIVFKTPIEVIEDFLWCLI